MSKGAMSLKAQIRNLAKKKNVKSQVLIQNFMFERFLERLSLSITAVYDTIKTPFDMDISCQHEEFS